ncbi:hypothetical protein CBD41_09935 [bacterium TMED181]|nr:hypothetical protein [Planctomycetota bacterium]OUW41822.1 MAG: hypothetical protein CBD41_09935 [bacterium TMED181]
MIDVPGHVHDVTLDLFRVVMQFDYSFKEDWFVRGRLPLERRTRTSSLAQVDPASTPEQIEAMERNLQIHHPSEVLKGFGDLELLWGWHVRDLGVEMGNLAIALGSTFPTGRTEENPYELGDDGEAHEHIQFGSGTFDPIIEFSYSRPIGEESIFSIYGQGRFPTAVSSKGYKGSQLVQGGMGVVTPLGKVGPWDHLNGLVGVFVQDMGRAYWDGVEDPNTGFQNVSLQLGISWRDEVMRSWNLSLILPLTVDTSSGPEGTYDPGPIINLAIGF